LYAPRFVKGQTKESYATTLQAAREVLNQQWLEEIPKLLKLSEEVLMTCMAVFIELIRRVQEDVLKASNNVFHNFDSLEVTFLINKRFTHIR